MYLQLNNLQVNGSSDIKSKIRYNMLPLRRDIGLGLFLPIPYIEEKE